MGEVPSEGTSRKRPSSSDISSSMMAAKGIMRDGCFQCPFNPKTLRPVILKDILGEISCRIAMNRKSTPPVISEGIFLSSNTFLARCSGTTIVAEGISGKDEGHIGPKAAALVVMDNAILKGARCLLCAGRIVQNNAADMLGTQRVLDGQVADSDPFRVFATENGHGCRASVLSINDTFFGGGRAFKDHFAAEFQREDFTCVAFRCIPVVVARADMDMPRIREIISFTNQQREGNRLIRIRRGASTGGCVYAVHCVYIDMCVSLGMTHTVKGEGKYNGKKCHAEVSICQ